MYNIYHHKLVLTHELWWHSLSMSDFSWARLGTGLCSRTRHQTPDALCSSEREKTFAEEEGRSAPAPTLPSLVAVGGGDIQLVVSCAWKRRTYNLCHCARTTHTTTHSTRTSYTHALSRWNGLV